MHKHYDKHFLEDLKNKIDIVSIISEDVELSQKGKDYYGKCPFHKSINPTFSVVPNKNIFYCFGCGKGGNAIHFIMAIKNMSFIEAVDYLKTKVDSLTIDKDAKSIDENLGMPSIGAGTATRDKINDRIMNFKDLQALFSYIYNYFSSNYTKAILANRKYYLGIKYPDENRRVWVGIYSPTELEIKLRIDVSNKKIKDNVNIYHISNIEQFDSLKPQIQECMKINNYNISEDGEIMEINEYEEKQKSFQEIIDDPSDIVKIYSIGSCNYMTREGKYFAILDYKGHYKAITGNLSDTTANRCIIVGLIEAVKLLKKPYSAILVTSTRIGIYKMKRGKGVNYDIVKELFDVLKLKECKPEFAIVEGEGEKLNNFILPKVKQLIKP